MLIALMLELLHCASPDIDAVLLLLASRLLVSYCYTYYHAAIPRI